MCLGKLRRRCISLGQDCAMTCCCIPIPSFAEWKEQVFDVMEAMCEFIQELLCGTRHRAGTCGKSKHLVRPRHSKHSVEVCRPCGVEQVGEESLAGAGEGEAGRESTQTHRHRQEGFSEPGHSRSTGGIRKRRDVCNMAGQLDHWEVLACSFHASCTHTGGALSVGVIACDAA